MGPAGVNFLSMIDLGLAKVLTPVGPNLTLRAKIDYVGPKGALGRSVNFLSMIGPLGRA